MPLIEVVCTVLSKNHRDQCLLCLDLVNVLLEIRGKDMITVPELRNVLIETLKKENDDVIDYDLRVLVKYVQYSQELTTFIRHILKVASDPSFDRRCWSRTSSGTSCWKKSRI